MEKYKNQKKADMESLDPTSLIHITNMTVQEAESQFS